MKKYFISLSLLVALMFSVVTTLAATVNVIDYQYAKRYTADEGYVELTGKEDSVTGRLTGVARDNHTKGTTALTWEEIQRPSIYTARMYYTFIYNNVAQTERYLSI